MLQQLTAFQTTVKQWSTQNGSDVEFANKLLTFVPLAYLARFKQPMAGRTSPPLSSAI